MGKILVMVNRDFVLYNFRIELIKKLLDSGYEVYISLPYGERVPEMIRMGCHYIETEIDRRGTNLFKDIRLWRFYKKIMREIQPDMVLTYTTKVCIYGGMAASAMKIPYIVNISGLGTAVENPGLLQKIMVVMYRKAVYRAKCVFFQNTENQTFFEKRHMLNGYAELIPGSGVNTDRFCMMDYPADKTVEFLFIARVIKEKGIEEYVKMAEIIRQKYPQTIFHILGPCDDERYLKLLRENEDKGVIQYHGQVSDTRVYLKRAHCIIHPTFYAEGMSNVLLESAACGRPVITTNRSGCREIVDDGVTGFLFEPRNTRQLIEKVELFLNLSNEQRMNMGIAARAKAEQEFDRKIVVKAYMDKMEEK